MITQAPTPPVELHSRPVAPLFIGPGNCEHLIGHRPRWVRKQAERLGVPVLRPAGSRKWLIDAIAFKAALEREGIAPKPSEAAAAEPSDEQVHAAMRDQVGLRRAGSRP
jgi:hypothetical protein